MEADQLRPPWAWCPNWARTTVGATVTAGLGAAAIAAITIGGTFGAQTHQHPLRHYLNPLGVALLTLSCAALVVRRRFPAATLLIAATAVCAYFALGFSWGPAFLPLVVAVATAVLTGHRLLAWIISGAAYLIIVWGGYVLPTAQKPADLVSALTTAAWPLVILVGAEVVRAGRERAATGRAERERRRASEERLRIAQELHDVLAHNISLISVQAGVALHLMDERPDEAADRARTALTAIRHASKEALGELRSVLGLLRASPDEHALLSPVPGMAQLSDLTSRATAAGLTVRTEITGTPRPLPAGTDLAAYRIVQEALTNVIRHAGATTVVVRVSYGDTSLDVQVEDDGGAAARSGVAGSGVAARSGVAGSGVAGATGVGVRTAAGSAARDRTMAGPPGTPDGGGNGIAGMRERARLLRGELTARQQRGKGFVVRARLPIDRLGRGTDRPSGTGDGAAHGTASAHDAADPGNPGNPGNLGDEIDVTDEGESIAETDGGDSTERDQSGDTDDAHGGHGAARAGGAGGSAGADAGSRHARRTT